MQFPISFCSCRSHRRCTTNCKRREHRSRSHEEKHNSRKERLESGMLSVLRIDEDADHEDEEEDAKEHDGIDCRSDDGDDVDSLFSFNNWCAMMRPPAKKRAAMATQYAITRSRSRECINGSRSYASQSKPRVERRILKRAQFHVCQSHTITHLRKRMLCRTSPQERKKLRKRLGGRRPRSP